MPKDKAKADATVHSCPNCGYCPHCGRSNQPVVPVPYPYPSPWLYRRPVFWYGEGKSFETTSVTC
jgi:hypothetical protein